MEEAIVKGVPALTIYDKTYDLNSLVAEKKGKDEDILRIIEAKFRIEAEASVPEEMLREFVDQLGDLTVKDISFGYTAVEETDRKTIVIYRGKKDYSELVTADHDVESHYHLYSLATYLTGKTFAEAMQIMNSVEVPIKVFDNVSTLILEGEDGLRVRFGCRDDCRLTMHYSSDPQIYQWFGDLCERYEVPVKVGVCGKIERNQTEYVGRKTGKTEQTDWTCLI